MNWSIYIIMLKTIDLLFSTYGNRVYDLLANLPNEVKNQKIIIVHQVSKLASFEDVERVLEYRNDILYIQQTSIGVTKSRNVAIKASTSDIILFCDDDVVYEDRLFDLIAPCFRSHEIIAMTFKIGSTEGTGTKNFKSSEFIHNRRTILSVGTIEIACRGESIRKNNISFPEELGAGARFPCCDEPVFLSKILKLEGSVVYTPSEIGSHPPLSSGQSLETFENLYSRKIAFSYIFGKLLSTPIFLLFIVKNINDIPLKLVLKATLSAIIGFKR